MIYETCDGLESFTRDPIGYEAGSNNVYSYVASSPLRAIDPSGLESWIPGPTVGGTNYPWIPPGTVLPGHPNSAPIPPMPSEEDYAKSKCYCACASIVNGIRYITEGDQLGGAIRNRCQAWADTLFPYMSRENSALRHCCAGGQMATRLGCWCAQCLEDNRDVAQYYGYGQSWENTQQAIYNDREGRKCANCTGQGASGSASSDVGDSQIKSCCLTKFNAKQLLTGNPTTGIPPNPLYPNIWPRIPPPNWWVNPAPVIQWQAPGYWW